MIKAVFKHKGAQVVLKGDVDEVVDAVEEFFYERQEPGGRECSDCKHSGVDGGAVCIACNVDKWEPKPEAQEYDDRHARVVEGLKGEGILKPEGGECKPNYRVHPAETIKEMIDEGGGIFLRQADGLSYALGGTSVFWLNLWKNYKEAQNESNNGV